MTNDVAIKLRVDGAAQAEKEVFKLAGGLDQLGLAATSSATGNERLAQAIGKVAHYGLAGGSIYSLANAYMSVKTALFEASAAGQRLSTQLNFATDGRAAKEMQWVSGLANGLGLELDATAKAYAGFAAASRGTALEGASTRQVFEGIAKASAVMGLSTDETKGALLAVQQMMSKGVVSAEEFRGQLGERMPIALQAGAQALGVTTAEFSKLLETGQIVAQDFLPKFSAAITTMLGDSVQQASQRLDASATRMANAWEQLKRTVGDAGVSAGVAKEMVGMSNYMQALSDSMDNAKAAGLGFFGVMNAGAAQTLGRMPFDVLNMSASTLNGTINALTGGVLGLNEHVSYMPEVFQTNAAKAAMLDGKLKEAKTTLADLQARLSLVPDNIYLKSEAHQAWLLVQQLQAAKQAKDALSGGGAGRGSVNPATVGQMEAENAKNEADLAKLKQSLSGVSKEYIDTMKEIGRLSAAGVLTGKDLTTAIVDAHKMLKDGPISEATKAADRGLKAFDDLMAKESGFAANFSETVRDMVAARDKGKISVAAYGQAIAEMLKIQPGAIAAEKALADATKDRVAATVRSINAELDAYYRERDAILAVDKALNDLAHANSDQLDALQYEATLMGQSATERARAIEQYRILAQYKAEAARIEATIGDPAVRAAQLAALNVQRQLALSNAAARDAITTWNETFDRVNTGLTDAIMAAGKDGGAGLRDFLEAELLSRPFRMVVQAIVQPIAGAMTGALVGDAGSAAGGGIINSALGSMIGQGATMASLGTAFGEGFMATLGGSSLGGGSAAGILATGGASGAGMAGMLGAAAPWALGAVALARILGGPGFTSATDSGRARIDYSAAGIGGAASNATGSQAQIDAQVIATNSLAKSYFDAAKTLGIQALASVWEVGTNTGREGAAPQTVLGVNAGGRSYSSGEISSSDSAGLSLAASRALMTALQASELPKYLAGVFDDITVSTATQDQINTALQSAQALKGFHDQLQTMPWGQLKDLSYQAAQGLAEAAGGLDKLGAGLGGFYDKFYSDSEKKALLLQNTSSALAALGETMPAIDSNTRDWYRSEVERAMALDQSVPANARLTAGLLALSGAMDSLAPALQDAAKAADDAAKAAGDRAMADLERSVAAEKQRLALARDIAQEQVTAVRSVFDTLKSNVQSLYASVASTRDMAAAQGQAYIAQALATAQSTGYLPDNAKLSDAITAARGGVDAAIYASQADADYARQVLAGQLGQLQVVAGTQLTTAERTLRAALDQIDGLDAILETERKHLDIAQSISDGVLSVADAIAALHQAIKPDADATGTGAGSSAGTGTAAGSGVVSFGGGSSPGGGDVARYFDTGVNVVGFGVSKTPIFDDQRIKVLDYINANVHENWDSAAQNESLAKIAQNAIAAGGTQRDVAAALGFSEQDVRKMFDAAGIPAFATGAAFTNGIVSRPTLFPLGQMGEKTAEAIMPLVSIGGSLGVRAVGGATDTARLEALIETLIGEIRDLKSISGAGSAAGQRLLVLLDDVTDGGNAIRSRAMGV